MDGEAGDALHHLVRDQVDPRVAQHVFQAGEPAACRQHRPDGVSGRDGPPDDLLALRHEQAALGLQALAQLDVAQPHVVGQPGVGGVGNGDELRHETSV